MRDDIPNRPEISAHIYSAAGYNPNSGALLGVFETEVIRPVVLSRRRSLAGRLISFTSKSIVINQSHFSFSCSPLSLICYAVRTSTRSPLTPRPGCHFSRVCPQSGPGWHYNDVTYVPVPTGRIACQLTPFRPPPSLLHLCSHWSCGIRGWKQVLAHGLCHGYDP